MPNHQLCFVINHLKYDSVQSDLNSLLVLSRVGEPWFEDFLKPLIHIIVDVAGAVSQS
jgi:hypothetical protein